MKEVTRERAVREASTTKQRDDAGKTEQNCENRPVVAASCSQVIGCDRRALQHDTNGDQRCRLEYDFARCMDAKFEIRAADC